MKFERDRWGHWEEIKWTTLLKRKQSWFMKPIFLFDFQREHHGGGTHVGVEHSPRARQHRPSPLEAVRGSRHGLTLCHGSHLHHAHDHECFWELHRHILIFYVSNSWFLLYVFHVIMLVYNNVLVLPRSGLRVVRIRIKYPNTNQSVISQRCRKTMIRKSHVQYVFECFILQQSLASRHLPTSS